ncbi:hypothetical protein DRE_01768 [Drechslerella stenobrocha 248]|uniref:N-acetylglucosaminylphosphatidylinositol deacetylase n=1 Tax=Drechslerella stenobrocha 248 TaxID=1043628 RepID=W7HWL8_9PEZI|nr:hypothetical protein DRE_01768 [Drechslerella stenobrocha 248]
MFFAPTLQAITNPSAANAVHIICFSTGNAAGIGAIRERELLASASLLGVPAVNKSVVVHDHPRLPDSMSVAWPEDLIASLMAGSLARLGNRPVDTIITFDAGGISGHPNHIALLAGARYYINHYPGMQGLSLYSLASVPIYRKYIGVLDAFVTALLQRDGGSEGGYAGGGGTPKSAMYLSGWREYRAAQRAMTEGHQSQMVWFRWGWITLSRYMVFNELVLDASRT